MASSWAQPDPSSHFTKARRRDDPLPPSKRARRLVIATTTGAIARGRATIAGRDTVGTKGGFALILVMAIAKAEHLLAVVHLGAAPDTAAVFRKHPHVEGRVAVILEVEGAPPAQATRAGKRLPTAG